MVCCSNQPLGGTLAPTATLSAKTLTSALQLDEHYDESLQTSELTTADEDADHEVATINGGEKRKKDKDNKILYHGAGSRDSGDEIQVGGTMNKGGTLGMRYRWVAL